jgi:hypothetical protein
MHVFFDPRFVSKRDVWGYGGLIGGRRFGAAVAGGRLLRASDAVEWWTTWRWNRMQPERKAERNDVDDTSESTPQGG